MRARALTQLSDAVLLRDLAALIACDRTTTAALLAHIGEVDARRLYLPAAYPSMHAFCVGELHLSEDAAYKRIQAARAARQFPILLDAVAEGRLHLAAVCLLAPHLTAENAGELVALATHRRKAEMVELLAQWAAGSRREPSRTAAPQLAPGQVGVHVHAAAAAAAATAPAPVVLRFAIGARTQEKLRYAQALLSHAVPDGDVAEVLERALDALIPQLEKRKFAATARPRAGAAARTRRQVPRGRGIPAHVRRAVWERDQGRCTFVSATGRRCASRRLLEFDHVEPFARGGSSTAGGLRLRCRAHHQYEAERAFGADFMRAKRDEARRLRAQVRAQSHAGGDHGDLRDVRTALRELGFRSDEARRGSEHAAGLAEATLEQRLRAALTFLGRRAVLRVEPRRSAAP